MDAAATEGTLLMVVQACLAQQFVNVGWIVRLSRMEEQNGSELLGQLLLKDVGDAVASPSTDEGSVEPPGRGCWLCPPLEVPLHLCRRQRWL